MKEKRGALRKRLELRGKARVGDFPKAVLTGQPVRGPSAEYADAEGCAGYVPMDLLARRSRGACGNAWAVQRDGDEHSSDPHAFARTDAAALGLSMPMVSPGESTSRRG